MMMVVDDFIYCVNVNQERQNGGKAEGAKGAEEAFRSLLRL